MLLVSGRDWGFLVISLRSAVEDGDAGGLVMICVFVGWVDDLVGEAG